MVKILSEEQLKTYTPGQNCLCAAWSRNECGCSDVDWTPTEVYQLRLKVSKLREPIKYLLKKEYCKLNCSGRPTRAETDIDYFERLLKETEI